MKKILASLFIGGQSHLSWPAEFGLLALRLGAGLGLSLAHGINKLPPSDQFIEGVEAMGLPLPIVGAWAAALAEFLGGILVAIGLLTRPAAFFALATMCVAFFVVHGGDPFSDRELAMLYGLPMLAFCLAGSGRLSVDRLIRGGVKPAAD